MDSINQQKSDEIEEKNKEIKKLQLERDMNEAINQCERDFYKKELQFEKDRQKLKNQSKNDFKDKQKGRIESQLRQIYPKINELQLILEEFSKEICFEPLLVNRLVQQNNVTLIVL